MRFVKPLDEALIAALADSHELLVTLEENVIQGGAGSAVEEALQQQGRNVPVLCLGLPDRFVEHGDHALLLKVCGLDRDGIVAAVRKRLSDARLPQASLAGRRLSD